MMIALLLLTFVAIQQDPPKENKPPKRGDVVVAKGCVKGGVLETAELTGPGESATGFLDLVTFRLTGDKKTLQEIKKEHDGHSDLITGELKTDLPTSAETRGKKIGNTRITIGVGDRRGIMQPAPPPMPVLKVTSFEHTGVSCR
jgi:hypothetical protein